MADPALRFFVDENLLPVGRALAAVRIDVAHPDHRRLPEVPAGTPDEDWLQIVGAFGLVAITRDRRIRRRPGQRAQLLQHGARVIALGGKQSLTQWEWLELVVRQWSRIDASTDRPGPWVQSLTAGGLADLPTTASD